MTAPEQRSPLRDAPLRNAGQSLQEQLDRLWADRVESAAMLFTFFAVATLLEWWRLYANWPPSPWAYSVACLLSFAYLAFKMVRFRREKRRLRLGLDGEKAVGQFLEGLRSQGYRVFHDLVGEGFNVDHALVGPAGVLTIETKTRSKPAKGDARVVCREGSLVINGVEPDRSPIVQAKAQASWLRSILSDTTGRRFEVWPVVVFPGWFVELDEPTKRELWVLEPKALPAFLAKEPQRLNSEDIALASFHLSRFIRSAERERNSTRFFGSSARRP